MTRYLARRLAFSLLLVVAAAVLTFLIFEVIPGNVVLLILGSTTGGVRPNPARIHAVQAELGLNHSSADLLLRWLVGLLRFNFGRSYITGQSVGSALASRLPISAALVLLAVLISVVISVPLGVLAAVKRNTWVDQLIRVFCSAGYSVPDFLLAIILVIVLVKSVGWFPPLDYANPLHDPLAAVGQLLVPAFCLGYRAASLLTRIIRSSMLEVLQAEYLRTAEAKGLGRTRVLLLHGLRSSLLPIVTMLGLEVVLLFGGTAVIETYFNIPGIGGYIVSSAINHDVPAVQGAVFALVAVVVAVNLVIDLICAWLDPRVRLTTRRGLASTSGVQTV
jgi:peptide/nickel transport system permease protein